MKAEEPNKCIFCLTTRGKFSTEEHIFPESIGNQDKLLPQGAVCDTCNHGVLSQLDQAFVEFEPIAYLKATFQIPSKHGRLKSLDLSDGKIKPKEGGEVEFRCQNQDQITKMSNGARISSTSKNRLTSKKCKLVARALLKQAYECAFLDHGTMMLESKYDKLRGVINNGNGFSGYIAVQKKVNQPSPKKCGLKYKLIKTAQLSGMITTTNYCGLNIATAFPSGGTEEILSEHIQVLRFSN